MYFYCAPAMPQEDFEDWVMYFTGMKSHSDDPMTVSQVYILQFLSYMMRHTFLIRYN